MMRPKIYIDGQAGTTGLRIREWLAGREDVELITIPEARRKDPDARREQVLAADLTILCLPDDAAREAAGWAREAGEASNRPSRILDASSAHRVDGGWVYGLPELASGQRDSIRAARFVSNPGCYPSAFVLLIRPLVDAGLLATSTPLSIHALSGYSGGGRGLIERWEAPGLGLLSLAFEAPYALDRVHKHVPEMTAYSGLEHAPQFVPAVGPFRCGMRVEVPLHARLLAPGGGGRALWQALADRYEGEPFVRVAPLPGDGLDERSLDPQACNDTNAMVLHVLANPAGHVLLVATLDNLGKGASGVAIQNLNIMLGLEERTGLPA